MSQQMVSSQDKVTTAQEQLTRQPMTSADRDRLERRMYPEDKALQAVDQYIDQSIDQSIDHGIDHAVEGVELDIAMESLRESMTHRALARDQARKISRDFRNR